MIGSEVLHQLNRGRPHSVAPSDARPRQSPIKERTSLDQISRRQELDTTASERTSALPAALPASSFAAQPACLPTIRSPALPA